MTKKSRFLLMICVFIATFMTSVEITIVTTALPTIISDIHGLAFQSWIMSAYLLTTTVTTPIYGKLADVWGRKNLFLFGLIMFTLGSFLSGLAPNIWLLIFTRAIQGIGAGGIMPLTYTIIADSYSFQQRARVIAFNNSAWALSALAGPLLGGFLVEYLNWHWVFFVNVPLGIIVSILIFASYKESKHPRVSVKIDWTGMLELALFLAIFLFGVQQLSQEGDGRNLAIIAIVISLGLVYIFVKHEKGFREALIPLKIFTNRTFTVQVITAALLSGLLIGYQVYFPIWLQSLYRVRPVLAGLVVTSGSIMWLIGGFLVGSILARFVPKWISVLLISLLIFTYTPLIFAGLNLPFWYFYVVSAISGGFLGIIITMNMILSQHLVSKNQIGTASSILTLGRTLGQTVSTGILGLLLNVGIRLNLHGISFSTVNNMISSDRVVRLSSEATINNVILDGLHLVFIFEVLILIIALAANLADPNSKIVD
ncbi:MFS transporter [Oenococcus oeni]|uniref:MFS transporter n=1 Tax=Oenococcus oeni TaxID=1247 RepID=UPI0008F8FF8C|nr:MFS transporter [Oenococcus oeni]OIM27240.1 MFS transporter [Oenococcus oeni]SYW13641.1 MFS transporter [Oenococcus oeni]